MTQNISIEFFPPESIPLHDLTYVIIGAREKDQWIFVNHKDRETWELPAGHIEEGESAENAAIRELYEETGTTEGTVKAIHDYSVTIDGKKLFGRIFFAKVMNRGKLPKTEIARIAVSAKSPEPATYPYAHWKFIDVLETYLSNLK